MKHNIAKMLVFALLAGGYAVSAEGEIPDGITIEGRKMTGTVSARFGIGYENERDETILVDCMAPDEVYSGEVFRLESRYFSKKDVQKALRTAGQSDRGRFINNKNETVYINTTSIEPAANISKEEAAEQAVEIGLKYFDALGVEVIAAPSHIERPYDYDAYIEERRESLSHRYSDIAALLDMAKAQWKRTRKYETREAAYTLVEFDVMADGMRIWNSPSYPAGYEDEPDAWVGFGVSASVLVSDSGVIVEARTSHIPEIKSRRAPKDGELEEFATLVYDRRFPSLVMAESWHEALSLVLADASGMGNVSANAQEKPYRNGYMDEPVMAYGSQTVITQIYPCLTTISEDEWAMLWYIGSQQQYADGWRY